MPMKETQLPFRTAAVLGAGVMGSQIAAHLASQSPIRFFSVNNLWTFFDTYTVRNLTSSITIYHTAFVSF